VTGVIVNEKRTVGLFHCLHR